DWDWTPATRVGVRGALYLGRSLVVSGGLFAAEMEDGRRFADPLVAGSDLILHEEEMTLSARVGGLRLRMGRDRHRWGPGVSGSLLLSDAGEPFSFAEYQVRLGSQLRFLALTGSTSPHQKRYLSAHRLCWTPTPGFSLSLSEGARYQANSPHLLYAVGFVPYTLVERLDFQDTLGDSTREEQRNNVLWAIDAVWRPRSELMIYAELLADDIAMTSSKMPTRGGLQGGLTFAPSWRSWDWTLAAEYTRVSNYTYSVYYQDQCLCDWEHQEDSIGYEFGPDVETLFLRCNVDPVEMWGGRLWLRHVRKGEGQIGQPWKPVGTINCSDGDPDCGDVDAWKLSGTVERTTVIGLELQWRPGPFTRVSTWFEAVHIRRPSHNPSSDSYLGSRLGCTLNLGIQ
ncbi:capsule assembly Wzi family protein, partial [Candidatus Eisenbacteria bacterium]